MRCYCRIPRDFLRRVVEEKFTAGVSTLELLRRYPAEPERQYVQAIALLDVAEAEVRELLKEDAGFLAHFLDCRRHALAVLRRARPLG